MLLAFPCRKPSDFEYDPVLPVCLANFEYVPAGGLGTYMVQTKASIQGIAFMFWVGILSTHSGYTVRSSLNPKPCTPSP